MKKLHTAIVCIALAIALLGCDEADKNTAKPTKPVLSAYRVRAGTAAAIFTKVTGHTYKLKHASGLDLRGVTLSDVVGDPTKQQVRSTKVISGIVVVATLDGNSIDSEPIDFLFHVADKATLQAEIKRAQRKHGNEVNLNYIDTSSVTDMSRLFSRNTTFNGDISKWDVSSVTTMRGMFGRATAFNQPLNSWDVSSVTTMSDMFVYATSFNQPLNSWDVSSVTNMWKMFFDASAFNQPLNSWDVSSVEIMRDMFYGASAFNQPLNNWDVSSVTTMDSMFSHATAFNQDISGWANKNKRYTNFMFLGANAMQESNKPSWAFKPWAR